MVQSMDADTRHGRAAPAPASALRGGCHATACTQSSWPSSSASSDAARFRPPASNVSFGAYLQQPPEAQAHRSFFLVFFPFFPVSFHHGSLRCQRPWKLRRLPVSARHQRASPLSLHRSLCTGQARSRADCRGGEHRAMLRAKSSSWSPPAGRSAPAGRMAHTRMLRSWEPLASSSSSPARRRARRRRPLPDKLKLSGVCVHAMTGAACMHQLHDESRMRAGFTPAAACMCGQGAAVSEHDESGSQPSRQMTEDCSAPLT